MQFITLFISGNGWHRLDKTPEERGYSITIQTICRIFDIANKEEKALVGKLGPLYFNYWKRTGKAGSDVSFFYLCAVWFLSEYRPFISRPVIIGFRERR